ncbi:unnamed protein product [Prorocentrum cordatum]|uniref:tRNA (cytosine(38)-C(5))-methyltransferase n=1 Tax=Prorocentrum cordatum TaxID=2364126 RepID=A0ABN9WZ58_9DINO|nr:unnamed protein product [Polarella glacialis]
MAGLGCGPASRGEPDVAGEAPAQLALPPRLRVCELFAGIGGWRVALQQVLPGCTDVEVSAFDSGPHCSEVYERNFGERCCRRNIEQLGPADLEGFDLWVMSPPCQPFTATKDARQRDLGDRRCRALEHLCALLPRLSRPPRWLALENVKGFMRSAARARWRGALAAAGYSDWEVLLDLASFGVPNHRTRYYLLAERSGRFAAAGPDASQAPRPPPAGPLPPGLVARGAWARERRAEIEEAHAAARQTADAAAKDVSFARLRRRFCAELAGLVPAAARALVDEEGGLLAGAAGWKLLPLPRQEPDAFMITFDADRAAAARLLPALAPEEGAGGVAPAWALSEAPAGGCRQIGDFLEEGAPNVQDLLVPAAVLAKPWALGLSYVEPQDAQSFCFTGHYGKVMHKSSGSLLHQPYAGGAPLDRGAPQAACGAVRFFSPKEILNILGFPVAFTLPPDMELKHCYKVVGNSIAVTVVADLLRALLLDIGLPRLARMGQAPPPDEGGAVSPRMPCPPPAGGAEPGGS